MPAQHSADVDELQGYLDPHRSDNANGCGRRRRENDVEKRSSEHRNTWKGVVDVLIQERTVELDSVGPTIDNIRVDVRAGLQPKDDVYRNTLVVLGGREERKINFASRRFGKSENYISRTRSSLTGEQRTKFDPRMFEIAAKDFVNKLNAVGDLTRARNFGPLVGKQFINERKLSKETRQVQPPLA